MSKSHLTCGSELWYLFTVQISSLTLQQSTFLSSSFLFLNFTLPGRHQKHPLYSNFSSQYHIQFASSKYKFSSFLPPVATSAANSPSSLNQVYLPMNLQVQCMCLIKQRHVEISRQTLLQIKQGFNLPLASLSRVQSLSKALHPPSACSHLHACCSALSLVQHFCISASLPLSHQPHA